MLVAISKSSEDFAEKSSVSRSVFQCATIINLSEPACFDLLCLRVLHPSYLFPLVEVRRRAAPSSLLFSVWCRWAQPERNLGGLHRLLDDCHQLLSQLVQVHFLAQGGAESCHGLGGIIL